MVGDSVGFDLTTVPDFDQTDPDAEARYADKRAEYLVRVTDLRKPVARGLAYRELGYTHSGIAKHCDVAEGTVSAWMADVADRFGERALETRPQSDPVEVLA